MDHVIHGAGIEVRPDSTGLVGGDDGSTGVRFQRDEVTPLAWLHAQRNGIGREHLIGALCGIEYLECQRRQRADRRGKHPHPRAKNRPIRLPKRAAFLIDQKTVAQTLLSAERWQFQHAMRRPALEPDFQLHQLTNFPFSRIDGHPDFQRSEPSCETLTSTLDWQGQDLDVHRRGIGVEQTIAIIRLDRFETGCC